MAWCVNKHAQATAKLVEWNPLVETRIGVVAETYHKPYTTKLYKNC